MVLVSKHKQLVRSFLDTFTQQGEDKLADFISENFEFATETWLGIGMNLKTEGDKAIVESFFPEINPCVGKLQPGDEIVSVQEGESVYTSLEEIRYYPWGLDPGKPVNIRARRSGEDFTCEITPVVFKFDRMPYKLEQWKEAYQTNKETSPDYQYTLEYMVEEGDLVACILSVTFTDLKLKRPFAYSQALVFQFSGEKIVSIFELRNTAAELSQKGYRILPPEA
jgi:C-terminal processing protease CtpA/Prc